MSQPLDCSSFISASMNELSLCYSPSSRKLTPRRLNKSNPNLSRFSTKKGVRTPLATPKTPNHAFDRFIPNRSNMNLDLSHYLVSCRAGGCAGCPAGRFRRGVTPDARTRQAAFALLSK